MIEARIRSRIEELREEKVQIDALRKDLELRSEFIGEQIAEFVSLLGSEANDYGDPPPAKQDSSQSGSSASFDQVIDLTNTELKEAIVDLVGKTGQPVSATEATEAIFGSLEDPTVRERVRNRMRTQMRRMAHRGELTKSDYVDPQSPTKVFFEAGRGGPDSKTLTKKCGHEVTAS